METKGFSEVLSGPRQKWATGTSLMVLPMQGTWVGSLVLEDPTCCGATKPTL